MDLNLFKDTRIHRRKDEDRSLLGHTGQLIRGHVLFLRIYIDEVANEKRIRCSIS